MVWLNLSPIPVGRRGANFSVQMVFTCLRYTERKGEGVDAGYMQAGLEEQDYSRHRESLVSDIPSGDGEIDNLFYNVRRLY
jgi:hypothetical protein